MFIFLIRITAALSDSDYTKLRTIPYPKITDNSNCTSMSDFLNGICSCESSGGYFASTVFSCRKPKSRAYQCGTCTTVTTWTTTTTSTLATTTAVTSSTTSASCTTDKSTITDIFFPANRPLPSGYSCKCCQGEDLANYWFYYGPIDSDPKI